MHKRLVNEGLIDLEIRSEGPLLIKSGLPGLEGPDMSPVVTFRDRRDPEPYIPGSSLKGVIRSHAESITRTLCDHSEEWRLGACDPFKAKDWGKVDGACAAKFKWYQDKAEETRDPQWKIAPSTAYRDSCPICKLFGSTFLMGRLSAPDAYLSPGSSYRRERRDGVGIDRFTGGASKNAKFDLEVVTGATFETRLRLTNFELWQLGLLAYVLHDMAEGLVPVGSGRSRGLGQVKTTVRWVELRCPLSRMPQSNGTRLWGLGRLESGSDRELYGYWTGEDEGVPLEGATPSADPLGLRWICRVEGPSQVLGLWQQVAPLATRYLEGYQIPPSMRPSDQGLGRR